MVEYTKKFEQSEKEWSLLPVYKCNASDLIENVQNSEENEDEEEEEDDDNIGYKLIGDSQNQKSSQYRQIIREIYGSDNSDSDETDDESKKSKDDDGTEKRGTETREKEENSAVSDIDAPSCSGLPPVKKRRTRKISKLLYCL
ncbi:hypothetical protein JTB14_000563 [Gonioctena quinquepunctata]|nr:hypothetical protein JTB14_000563 [Gonioctena quinquepunctata]